MLYQDAPNKLEFEIKNTCRKQLSTNKLHQEGITNKANHEGLGLAVNTDLKLSEITGLKMYFFTGLNAVLYVVPCNLSCDMIYQKF